MRLGAGESDRSSKAISRGREAAELRLLYSAGSDSGREREEETSDALLAHSTGELSYVS